MLTFGRLQRRLAVILGWNITFLDRSALQMNLPKVWLWASTVDCAIRDESVSDYLLRRFAFRFFRSALRCSNRAMFAAAETWSFSSSSQMMYT